ncbi:AraC family transcriptional regulator [Sphingobacterium alkalisoli]|uniref:AraC family transcriptional regulator n=1 Tax=Sphingobacterium alkalisoli TaxID=1874115 RepID=A0A4U0H639_9SPHI|nr:helix-turn-helix domain-containing protein [Sphingobacterium alkalisoli]TJY65802.1 AraC family transcriptional regulator [Sphingobacterium alkalisoli]GGH18228.1 hypothetical protein GCM10011418_21720 [Sphingobacterium alkalisoli]
MKKSFHLQLHEYFNSVESLGELQLEPTLLMQHAEASYWKTGKDEAILQEFDGQRGFLYHLDVTLEAARMIPLEIDRSDLHILYVLSSDGSLFLYDTTAEPLTDIACERARYLYLPPDDYAIELPKGRSQIFGLYFSGRIFRHGNERPYDFLKPLIAAYRDKAAEPQCSIDFSVGPQTKLQIEIICRELRAKQLNNEAFIYAKLIQLIELSLEKVGQEQTKEQHDKRIAVNARNLLALYIEDEGQSASLKRLKKDLKLDSDTISRSYKRYFGTTLSDLREELLLEKAKEYLRAGHTATETAYALNYSSIYSFSRFFKTQAGISVSEYVRRLRKGEE